MLCLFMSLLPPSFPWLPWSMLLLRWWSVTAVPASMPSFTPFTRRSSAVWSLSSCCSVLTARTLPKVWPASHPTGTSFRFPHFISSPPDAGFSETPKLTPPPPPPPPEIWIWFVFQKLKEGRNAPPTKQQQRSDARSPLELNETNGLNLGAQR